MYKVIIIDDEVHICSLIKNLLEIENIPVMVDRCFYEGEESLKYILEKQPDIVITDIQIGDMTGLDIISKVRQQKMDTLFIIISGYNYFDYAKQAISYGVENYLLKPIQKKELSQAMNKVMAKLDERNGIEKNIEEIVNQKRESDERIFIQELWYRGSSIGKLGVEELDNKYGLRFAQTYFVVGVVHMDGGIHYEEENSAVLMEHIFGEFRKIMNMGDNAYAAGSVGSRNFCFIINCRSVDVNTVNGMLKNYTRKMAELYLNDNLKVTVSASYPGEWNENIYTAVEAARAGIAGRLQIRNRRVIFPADSGFIKDREYLKRVRKIENRLEELLETMELQQIKEECRYIFQDLYKQGKPCELTEISVKIVEYLEEKVRELVGEEELLAVRINIVEGSYRDIKAFYNDYLDNIDSLLGKLEYTANGAETKLIAQIKDYIRTHYKEHLELEDLSGQVYLTPAYLGALFKESTGKSVKEYLTELRMEKAKELLCDIRYNIGEVAEQTGYSDAKYFSKIFKKTIGIKPTEYRKIHQKIDRHDCISKEKDL